MINREIVELFGCATEKGAAVSWGGLVRSQTCPYLARKCVKVRKSRPEISIGSCSVRYGKFPSPVVICPFRFLERRQVFTDALHLLSLHQPGHELHVVPEVSIPGGSVDYFLVSARQGKPVDFVGVELQTLDTTGTVWPARQRFLDAMGVKVERSALKSDKTFGMNWKMTVKTIFVQLHHKVNTFEHVSKHLVLAVQDCLLAYMRREFSLEHLNKARNEDSVHVHSYSLETARTAHRLRLGERFSTDSAGVAQALGLQTQARMDVQVILATLERKMSDQTLWSPA